MSPRTLRRFLAGALVASVVVPSALVRGERVPRLCAFHALTGRSCPSCGMTRSWNAMGHGDLRGAAGYHLLGPATFVGAALLVAVGDRRAARVVRPDARMRPILGALAAIWLGAWAGRLVGGED
jgi:hypothetical protein